MNIVHLNGDVFDLDQVVTSKLELDCLRLTFRNGDQIPVHWRDERERVQIVETLQRALPS